MLSVPKHFSAGNKRPLHYVSQWGYGKCSFLYNQSIMLHPQMVVFAITRGMPLWFHSEDMPTTLSTTRPHKHRYLHCMSIHRRGIPSFVFKKCAETFVTHRMEKVDPKVFSPFQRKLYEWEEGKNSLTDSSASVLMGPCDTQTLKLPTSDLFHIKIVASKWQRGRLWTGTATLRGRTRSLSCGDLQRKLL